MRKVTRQPTFETPDGREFTDAKAAKRYETAWQAEQEYREAVHRLNLAVARLCKTADGHLFDFDSWHPYWFVTAGLWSLPGLRRIEFSWTRHWSLREYPANSDGTGVVLVDDSQNKQTHGQEYPIAELYYDDVAALRALVAAQEAWLAERAKEADETKARLPGKSREATA